MSAEVAASNTFLSGEGVPVPLADIEEELARLWGPTAEREGGPDLENPAITRVSLANLVVSWLGPQTPDVAAALDLVAVRNPCRVIVLRLDDPADRPISAAVSAQCALPAPGVSQVCSERIVLSAGADQLHMLPSAVRPLLEPDLPLVVWWIGDPRPHEGLFRDFAREATRLVPDLPDPAAPVEALATALDPESCQCSYTRDLAWFGISRWRELVAAFFDPAGSDALLEQLHTVEIAASAEDDERPARVAAWLGAWLAGQLGWKPQSRRVVGNRLEARFAGRTGTVELIVHTRARPGQTLARVDRVALHSRPAEIGDEDRFVLERIDGSEHVRIETCSHQRCSLGRVVHAAEPDAARRFSAALESSRFDPPYQAARPILLWLLGG